MIQYSLCSNSSRSINLKYLSYQATHFLTPYLSWKIPVFSSLNLPVEISFKLCEERQSSCQYDIQYDTTCPYICCFSVVRYLPNQVWVHIVWCSTLCTKLVPFINLDGKSKIYNLNLLGASQVK